MVICAARTCGMSRSSTATWGTPTSTGPMRGIARPGGRSPSPVEVSGPGGRPAALYRSEATGDDRSAARLRGEPPHRPRERLEGATHLTPEAPSKRERSRTLRAGTRRSRSRSPPKVRRTLYIGAARVAAYIEIRRHGPMTTKKTGKKPKVEELALNRETVQDLTESEAEAAEGGA